MSRRFALLCALFSVGCGTGTVPTAKYFFEKPVSHWLTQATNANPKVRLKAVEVLGNVGPVDPGAIPALIVALKDKDAKVRTAAVVGLAKIGSAADAALPTLRELADLEKNQSVRKHIQTAIARLQGQT